MPFKEIDLIFALLETEKRWLSPKWIDDLPCSESNTHFEPISNSARVGKNEQPNLTLNKID
jgi:hypothetical protein